MAETAAALAAVMDCLKPVCECIGNCFGQRNTAESDPQGNSNNQAPIFNICNNLGPAAAPPAPAAPPASGHGSTLLGAPSAEMEVVDKVEPIIMGPWGYPNEGFFFDHYKGYDGIKTIKIWCRSVIDSIEVQYTKRGVLQWASKVGGVGGDLQEEIVLEDGEYINEVMGTYARLFGSASINSLTFFTNRNNKFGPYGFYSGTTEEEKEAVLTPFHVKGGKIVGFHGTSDQFISSIGFSVSPLEVVDKVELIITGAWGHPNEGFSFDHNKGYDGIKTIRIWCGWVIDSIEVQYTKRGVLQWASKAGGSGGKLQDEIVLEDGEYINEVTGIYGRLFGSASINSLTFFTNRNNRFGPYGFYSGIMEEEKEAVPTFFHVRGGKIVGFHGTSDQFISSIGFYVSPLV